MRRARTGGETSDQCEKGDRRANITVDRLFDDSYQQATGKKYIIAQARRANIKYRNGACPVRSTRPGPSLQERNGQVWPPSFRSPLYYSVGEVGSPLAWAASSASGDLGKNTENVVQNADTTSTTGPWVRGGPCFKWNEGPGKGVRVEAGSCLRLQSAQQTQTRQTNICQQSNPLAICQNMYVRNRLGTGRGYDQGVSGCHL
jgi:hypothetical protein